jgi:hypothetical protein
VIARDRSVGALLDPTARAALHDVNALALDQRRRRAEHAWRRELVPIAEAAARLGVPLRTLRARAQRGQVAAVKDDRGRWLIEAA